MIDYNSLTYLQNTLKLPKVLDVKPVNGDELSKIANIS